jgi:hypothetical protein
VLERGLGGDVLRQRLQSLLGGRRVRLLGRTNERSSLV